MTEIGRILGPGCDISVELNNPFETDFAKLLFIYQGLALAVTLLRAHRCPQRKVP